jgi:hypothetical protein
LGQPLKVLDIHNNALQVGSVYLETESAPKLEHVHIFLPLKRNVCHTSRLGQPLKVLDIHNNALQVGNDFFEVESAP